MDAASSDYRFGRFRLDAARRVLLADGKPARLGARAVDVLIALVQRRDRIVGKDELFELVWPGVVVEENNLQVHVSALRKLLGPQTIATIPGRGYQFIAPLDGDVPAAPPAAAPSARATNLPPVAPLYGRDDDLAAVRALAAEHPLVTIVGAGGIGKTHLALAVAQQVAHSFTHGAWLVDLAAVADGAQVVAAVARTLGIVLTDDDASPATVTAALREQSMLLVLDNCEHVLEPVATLIEALRRGAPGVRVLATSQEPLKLAHEQIVRLAPLAVDAADSGAVQLFVARAQAADRGFAPTPDNLPAVSEICRRLDGLPLAIELAAARMPLLGVEGIRARLNERFRVLTAGARFAPRRHQTLHAAFDWSHDLLSPDEQTVFRRLGVFVGGFSLELAQRVASDARIDRWAVLDHLGGLVDKSLVIAEGREAPRYRLLETGRAFALEQLERAGETDELMRRHAHALRHLLQAFDAAVVGEQRFDPLVRGIEAEFDNVRAALAWAAAPQSDRETAIALAATSDWLWNEVDVPSEGLHWCRLIRPWVDESTPLPLSARFWLTQAGLGRVALLPAHEWVESARKAADGFRALGDDVGLYRALCLLGSARDDLVDAREAGAYLEEAAALEQPHWSPRLRLRRQNALEWWHYLGDRRSQAREAGLRHVALAREAGGIVEVGALTNLASTELELGNVDAAIDLCRLAVARAAEIGRPSAAVHAYENLVPALLERGDLDGATEAMRAGRAISVRRLGNAFSLLIYLLMLVERRGDARLTARLLGYVDRVYEDSRRTMHPEERRTREKLLAKLEATLPAKELEALRREGAAWTEDEAFARAGLS